MQPIDRLLLENKAWSDEKRTRDPNYFATISGERIPDFFWIGCSDSRVHADEITHSEPGEIFVHRNIANLVATTDMNFLSALEYAVDILKVKHVIVCGHYGCGGIRTAMSKARPGQLIVNKWLKHIKDIYRLHREEIAALTTSEEQWKRLVELNVIEQVRNLGQISIIQKAWITEKRPSLHGWVYGLHDGIIKEIAHMDAGSEIDPIYQYNFDTTS